MVDESENLLHQEYTDELSGQFHAKPFANSVALQSETSTNPAWFSGNPEIAAMLSGVAVSDGERTLASSGEVTTKARRILQFP